jgi:outer membrane immunogenic protein
MMRNSKLIFSAAFAIAATLGIGGGIEWMFMPNWSVFAEYNYMDFATRT